MVKGMGGSLDTYLLLPFFLRLTAPFVSCLVTPTYLPTSIILCARSRLGACEKQVIADLCTIFHAPSAASSSRTFPFIVIVTPISVPRSLLQLIFSSLTKLSLCDTLPTNPENVTANTGVRWA